MSDRLSILQHALGLDRHGKGHAYRNHYVTGEGCETYALLQAMASEGLVIAFETGICGPNDRCFHVTEAGREYVRRRSSQPPKLTRSQKRYRDWLKVADVNPDAKFGDYLKRKTP